MKPEYVFIVGLPRTGTKLVKNVLEGAPGVHCKLSPETFFLGHFLRPGLRQKLRSLGDLRDDASIERLVELLYSGKLQGTYWQHLRNGKLGVKREAFLKALLATSRDPREVYRTILEIHATPGERTFLGDKTPGNLYHVPEILEWFPEAKIVHTFRDLRAIMVSEWRRRMKKRPGTTLAWLASPVNSFLIVLHVTVTWLHAIKLHHRYQKRYPANYYLSKFEDLVNQPEENTRRLCGFLGIPFHERMLKPRQVGSSYERQAATGFDQEALTRWQSHLKPWMKAWIWFWGRKHLREFGYLGPARASPIEQKVSP